jgi:hypothetical protein
MATANVKISATARETLRRIALEEGESEQSVLDRAVDHYRREKFLRDANADFAALKKSRRAWSEELRERKLWDETLSDGIEDE